MSEDLFFSTDAAIINRLGLELVARQETALIELIKNCFDADATDVRVFFRGTFPTGTLEIRDNGSGMTREELVDGYLRLASDLKVREPISRKYRRQRAGRKGIGRLATQRLGKKLVLTTHAVQDQPGLTLTVDWTEFIAGRPLDGVRVNLKEALPASEGTTLRIETLREEWTDSQIRRAWRGILALEKPYPVAPVENAATADPGFRVRLYKQDTPFTDESLVADLQSEILDHLHATIEMRVGPDGLAAWRLLKNAFGDTVDWTSIHHQHRSIALTPTYEHLRRAWMKAHYVVLSPELLPSMVFTRVRDVLAAEGGIRLYRNGFRVVPYGDPGNDWLGLATAYAKRSVLAPISNRNFFGIVEVRDSEGALFEEHTSREGLIETPAFEELRGLTSAVLVTAATRMAADRGRKTKAGRTRTQTTPSGSVSLDQISEAVEATKRAVDSALQGEIISAAQTAAQEAAGVAVRLVSEKKEEVLAVTAQLADEASTLRFLATLGMTAAEFSHETGMTFDAFRQDFERVFEAAAAANPGDDVLRTQTVRARSMLKRLDTLTSYLNSLASARAARGIRPQSLRKALRSFEDGVRPQAESQYVMFDLRVPAYDPLFTKPMHEAELASVLLNFYTNALKALRRTSQERRMLIEGDRPDPGSIRLRFSDTGDGIVEGIRERIFDAFFTTQTAAAVSATETELNTGAGLGLWIVQQIVSNSGGTVAVVSPPHGFSTCFELILPSEDSTDLT